MNTKYTLTLDRNLMRLVKDRAYELKLTINEMMIIIMKEYFEGREGR